MVSSLLSPLLAPGVALLQRGRLSVKLAVLSAAALGPLPSLWLWPQADAFSACLPANTRLSGPHVSATHQPTHQWATVRFSSEARGPSTRRPPASMRARGPSATS
jgi:hypothetical protein